MMDKVRSVSCTIANCLSFINHRLKFCQKLEVMVQNKTGELLIIINDFYAGSSTHPKVVFREVLHSIELEFGNVDF